MKRRKSRALTGNTRAAYQKISIWHGKKIQLKIIQSYQMLAGNLGQASNQKQFRQSHKVNMQAVSKGKRKAMTELSDIYIPLVQFWNSLIDQQ